MVELLYQLFKTLRPRQWLKNTALFAPLIFSGFLFYSDYFYRVGLAFILFSATASSLYLINDILDMESDRKHPFKRKRPIASGELPISTALFVSILLMVISLSLSYFLSTFFFVTVLTYIALQITYSVYLKKIPILDVLTIAAGFVLRVYAGAFVIGIHMNVWFLLTVISASLFLAVGKRQSERTLLSGLGTDPSSSRNTLQQYSQRLLDIYTGMFANTTWLTYALFAYQLQYVRLEGRLPTLFALLPLTLTTQKWLMATVPIVIYGVMRYLQLVYEQNKGESPERVLLSDKPLLTTVIIWGIMVIVIIYGIAL